MRSRDFISWFGDYDQYLPHVQHLIGGGFGEKARRQVGNTVGEEYLSKLVARWLDDVVDAPSFHLWLWGLNAELAWLLANVPEAGLEHLCRRYKMAVRPRRGDAPFTGFFRELHESLSVNLTDRPETTAQSYLGIGSQSAT